MTTLTYQDILDAADELRATVNPGPAEFRIIERPPVKTHHKVWRTTKSKVGKKRIQVKRFAGWVDLVKPGKPFISERRGIIIAHPADADRIRKLQGKP